MSSTEPDQDVTPIGMVSEWRGLGEEDGEASPFRNGYRAALRKCADELEDALDGRAVPAPNPAAAMPPPEAELTRCVALAGKVVDAALPLGQGPFGGGDHDGTELRKIAFSMVLRELLDYES